MTNLSVIRGTGTKASKQAEALSVAKLRAILDRRFAFDGSYVSDQLIPRDGLMFAHSVAPGWNCVLNRLTSIENRTMKS